MKVFILGSRKRHQQVMQLEVYLHKQKIGLWLESITTPEEDFAKYLPSWLNESDLVIILVNNYYLNSEWWANDLEDVQHCKRTKLIVKLEPVVLPEIPFNCTVLDCYDEKNFPQTVYKFIKEKKRMRVFVSYSRLNSREAKRLVAKLKTSLNRTWIDSSGLEHGEQFPTKILQEIKDCDCFILLWSRHSRQSRWVEKEWNHAFKLEKRIIPVILDKTDLPMVLEDTHAFTSFDDSDFCDFFDIPKERDSETKKTMTGLLRKLWCRLTGK